MNAAEKKTFSLLMLRPDKQFYEGEVRSLTAAEPDGQISLLPGHMPMFINITTGMASLTEADGTKRTFATGEGMLAVYRDKVVLQSDFLAWEEKLDEAIKRRVTAMAVSVRSFFFFGTRSLPSSFFVFFFFYSA